MVAIKRFMDEKGWKKLMKKIKISKNLARTLDILSGIRSDDEEENDKSDDVQYEYINLVYPPNSTPPSRDSIKKINIIQLNQISLKL